METTAEFLINSARTYEGEPRQAWTWAQEMLDSAPPLVRAALEAADAAEKKRLASMDDFPNQLEFLKKLIDERDKNEGDDWKRGGEAP